MMRNGNRQPRDEEGDKEAAGGAAGGVAGGEVEAQRGCAQPCTPSCHHDGRPWAHCGTGTSPGAGPQPRGAPGSGRRGSWHWVPWPATLLGSPSPSRAGTGDPAPPDTPHRPGGGTGRAPWPSQGQPWDTQGGTRGLAAPPKGWKGAAWPPPHPRGKGPIPAHLPWVQGSGCSPHPRAAESIPEMGNGSVSPWKRGHRLAMPRGHAEPRGHACRAQRSAALDEPGTGHHVLGTGCGLPATLRPCHRARHPPRSCLVTRRSQACGGMPPQPDATPARWCHPGASPPQPGSSAPPHRCWARGAGAGCSPSSRLMMRIVKVII